MVIVHACVDGAGQGEDPGADSRRQTSRRWPPAITMSEGRKALLTQASKQPTEVAKGEAQEQGGLLGP